MMGGDMLPPNAYVTPDILSSKHEYVTAEATVLVGVLVLFYATVILVLFGMNIPCSRWSPQRSPHFTPSQKKEGGRPAILENDLLQVEEPQRELQVTITNGNGDRVLTEVAVADEFADEAPLEGVSIV